MLKIIILVMVWVSLSAGIVCEDSKYRYEKYNTLFGFALEEQNVAKIKYTNSLRLKYLELSIASCIYSEEIKLLALEMRVKIKKIDSILSAD